MTKSLTVSFWGTRGSYPQSGLGYVKTGGHTSCVSLQTPEHTLFFDAGTGLITAGSEGSGATGDEKSRYHILLSHLHLDHILGIPFFKPLWIPETQVHFYTGMLESSEALNKALSTIFSPPYFPASWEAIPAKCTYHTFHSGKTFNIGTVLVRSVALRHPGGATGYRVEVGGKSVVYLTDTCHPLDQDDTFAQFCDAADLLIYDATFTTESWKQHPDWGHSTWYEGCQLARRAGVRQLALFHHAPEHTDTILDDILRQAQEVFPAAFLAHDGHSLSL